MDRLSFRALSTNVVYKLYFQHEIGMQYTNQVLHSTLHFTRIVMYINKINISDPDHLQHLDVQIDNKNTYLKF